MKTTHTKEKDGLRVIVNIDRGVKDETSYADGWNVSLGKKTYEFIDVKIEKGGKTAFTRDLNFFYPIDRTAGRNKELPEQAFARLGDTYISEPVYYTIKIAIDEAKVIADSETNEEYAKVKAYEVRKEAEKKQASENLEKAETADIQKKVENGFCFNCESYCYGDCGNYQKRR